MAGWIGWAEDWSKTIVGPTFAKLDSRSWEGLANCERSNSRSRLRCSGCTTGVCYVNCAAEVDPACNLFVIAVQLENPTIVAARNDLVRKRPRQVHNYTGGRRHLAVHTHTHHFRPVLTHGNTVLGHYSHCVRQVHHNSR